MHGGDEEKRVGSKWRFGEERGEGCCGRKEGRKVDVTKDRDVLSSVNLHVWRRVLLLPLLLSLRIPYYVHGC